MTNDNQIENRRRACGRSTISKRPETDPLQKCFMGTSRMRGFDWDGSNQRERLPQCGRSAGTAGSDPRPEGAHRHRGPGQHRRRRIAERLDDLALWRRRCGDAGVHLHGRIEDRARPRASGGASLLPWRSLRRLRGPGPGLLRDVLAVEGDHFAGARDVLQRRLLSRIPRPHGLQGLLEHVFPAQRRARVVDRTDGCLVFEWRSSPRSSNRQRYMYLEKFTGVLPHLPRDKIARFPTMVSANNGLVVVYMERIS